MIAFKRLGGIGLGIWCVGQPSLFGLSGISNLRRSFSGLALGLLKSLTPSFPMRRPKVDGATAPGCFLPGGE